MPRHAPVTLAVVCILAALTAPNATAAPPKRVLILLSESTEMPSLAVTVREAVASMRATAGGPLYISTESLERSRFPEDDRRLLDLFRQRYASARPDLVVAISLPAVTFVLRHRDELLRDVPLMYAFVDERMTDELGAPPLTTGVTVRQNFADLVELALRLHPRARRLVVVGGVSEFDRGWEASFRHVAPEFAGRVEVSYLTEASLPEALGDLATLPSDSLIFFLSMSRDRTGAVFVARDVLDMVRRVSQVPIFGPAATYLGHGIVGGPAMDFEKHGRDVGRMAGRLLAGEPVSAVTPEVTTSRLAFDWRELNRFGIPERVLPAGAEVLYRPSELGINTGWIVAIAVLIVAQTLLIVALTAQRRKSAVLQRRLDERLRFETLLSEVSTALSAVSLRGLDATVRSVLERSRRHFDVDHVVILDAPGTPGRSRAADASESGDAATRAVRAFIEAPHGALRLASFRPLAIARLDDLPHDAAGERTLLEEAGIRSLAMIAMQVGDRAVGVLCCISRTREIAWPAERQQQLRALAEAVANALQRQQTESAVADSDRLRGSILSSIPAQIAVLDREGTIIAVNESWLAFAVANEVRDEKTVSPGVNYLDVCRRAAADGAPDAETVLEGVRAVCRGQQRAFDHEYRCDAPGEQRWFHMKVAPLRRTEGGAVVTHRDVTADKRQELALRELTGRLIHAQEEERHRIARELHDDLQQRLALLAIELDGMALGRPLGGHDDCAANARRLWNRTNEISSEIHRISHRLLPLKLETLGLVATIDSYCREVTQHGVRTMFTHRDVPASIPDHVALCLFRVIQEALRNVVKHSGSLEAQVSLTGRDGHLRLVIADSGRGFDPEAAFAGGGLGLASMQERLRLVGGVVRIESGAGAGTRIDVAVPLHAAGAERAPS